MFGKHTLYKLAAIGLVAVLALAAVSFVGAQAQDTPKEQPPLLGITFAPGEGGAVVTSVLPGSPADKAGLEVGDIITTLNGESITADTIADAVHQLNAGDKLDLSIQRGDETLDLSATLAESQPGQRRPFGFEFPLGERPYLGIRLEDGENGVSITEVVADSPAAEAGLQVGDIIKSVNGASIETARDAVNAIRDLKVGDKLTLDITRDGAARTVEATLAAAPMMQSFGQFGDNNQIGIQYNADDQSWQISRLTEENPLYEAGLREGDAITKFDNKVYTPETLIPFLTGLESDATVTLTVQRGDETLTFDVSAKALSPFAFMPFNFDFRFRGDGEMPFDMPMMTRGALLGVEFAQLDEQVAQEHNVTETEGALITQVIPDSPAAEAGLQVGDIVKSVDGDVLDTERTLRDRLLAYEPGDTVTLSVLRDGATQDISVTLGGSEMPAGMFQGLPFDFHQFPMPRGFQFNIPFEQPQPDAPRGNNL